MKTDERKPRVWKEREDTVEGLGERPGADMPPCTSTAKIKGKDGQAVPRKGRTYHIQAVLGCWAVQQHWLRIRWTWVAVSSRTML